MTAIFLKDCIKSWLQIVKILRSVPERIEQIKKDLNNFLFVYEESGIVRGTIFATLCLDSMYQFKPYAVVENIIVNTAFRGNGIGKRLLEHVEQMCILKGCTKIMLLSSASRIEAHEFFEKNGFNGTVSKGFKKYIPISN